ncbi:hypothetical protein D3Y57_11370 [Sphingomonas paeninsulae]|jgi:hypothetical protein|uniref:Uncharacterized protein n=1 Tax=Sphingomonas paeninsulae TaxID=2319844 RepID=A0A494TKV6_SPHPE|nr:hypothetical protein [Sphingomonas paeninsulae]AYJ86456.1 hypothetical protein D3Y57_11370 [Sphingomonas paeninsulae]
MNQGLAQFSMPAYLHNMSFIPRPTSPRVAWRDAVSFMRQRRPHQIVFAALAIGIPILVILAFINEFNRPPEWHPPEIMYVQQWSAERTRAEIAAQQARDLPAELAKKKQIEEFQAERRAQFKRARDALRSVGI